jgi:DnaJ-class molecular chaperone
MYRKIVEAYEILSDEKEREKYDFEMNSNTNSYSNSYSNKNKNSSVKNFSQTPNLKFDFYFEPYDDIMKKFDFFPKKVETNKSKPIQNSIFGDPNFKY